MVPVKYVNVENHKFKRNEDYLMNISETIFGLEFLYFCVGTKNFNF